MAPSFKNNSVVGRMMGKSRKFSKGQSFGFVPDNRVETMGESEGYGSSGRVDTEMTASEDSCAPSRKRVNLGKGQFGVPMQVLSLAKMSKFEREELRVRLERELAQVRAFQKGIEQGLSSSRKPVTELSRIMVGAASHTKKRGPPGRSGNGGVGSKVTGRVLPPTTGYAMLMKSCESLLKRLMMHNFSYVFNDPVDPVKLNIPDYFSVIKHPMDLGTVKTKLLSGRYVDPWGFAADVRLTFTNALNYNPKGNNVHTMAETLSKFFEVRWKTIEKKLPVASTEAVVPMRQRVIESEAIITSRHSVITETDILMPPYKKKRTSSFENEKKQEHVKMPISEAEKLKLRSDLMAILSEMPGHILNFLREVSSSGDAEDEDELEIDFDAFSDETIIKLQKLIDDHVADRQKNSVKTETCEIELQNESGFNNSSMQACQDNDGIEEEVDIGGNDPPISNFPPVEIEKDTAVGDSICSSSSSSSGSSSDSDSDSSSESELDGAKAPAIENKDTEVNMEQMTAVPRDAEDSINVVGQVEQNSYSIPVSGEVKGRQEGESAPSERQVSPDKLYRAALLRNRFADTILKAQEKTNGKVAEQDRERLRLEKEELEKRRKIEKARLQAEAKAAEEALENAKSAAAAEAKRKRELEREASRQALQKMEKMVDINDNSQFLEDLEMLSVAPAEPLQSLIDETSADGSQDLLGSFNFKGSGNPLEQLGLFMKNDDDDDEDIELRSAPTRGADPEEGEID